MTHPGRQHSHQAALGLHAAGLLAGYWAGAPSLAGHRLLPAALWGRLVSYAPVALPRERVRWAPWAPALRRASAALLPGGPAAWADLAACRLFDRWAASGLGAVDAQAVITCEISARDTFRAARRRGVATILDAPSFHHAAQDRLHGFAEPERVHRRVTRVKDEEIALADHVLTVSELARATYLAAGVAPEKVHAVPLGADTALFAPRETPRAGPCRFLFAGAMIRRKGFDLLLEAFTELVRSEPRSQLRLVGPRGDASPKPTPALPQQLSFAGVVSQAELARELAEADCLVLPSRDDSFGMVVPEALAAGVPVLVTDQVGAKDLVQEGVNGWVIPAGDARALGDALRSCAQNVSGLREMSEACRRSAEAATWPAYHRRLSALMKRLVPA